MLLCLALCASLPTYADTVFVTSVVPGFPQRNYDGWFGMKIVVGAQPMAISSLGRWVLPGNGNPHAVKLLDASGVDIPGGSVTVDTTGKPAGAFTYAALAAPVTLAAGGSYFLLSRETYTGDFWYWLTSPITTTSDAHAYATSWTNVWAEGSAVPLSFMYTVGQPPPPPPSPTASLSANPVLINSGQTSTLSWSSTNTTACSGTGFITASGVSGAVSVTPVITTNYSIVCTGAGGSANAVATVTVTPAPPPPPPPPPPPGVILANTLTPTNCPYLGANPLGTGAFELNVNCAGLAGPVTVPQGYGKYKFDFSIKGNQLRAGQAFPILRIWIDETFVTDFTINTASYTSYPVDYWLRTGEHKVKMLFLNTYVLNQDGQYYYPQIDIQSLAISAYPNPPAPVFAQFDASRPLGAPNTIYRMTADSAAFPALSGENSTLDCQGHKVSGAAILANNGTIKNCQLAVVTVYSNHSTIQNNTFKNVATCVFCNPTFIEVAGGYFHSATTSGHLIDGNTFSAVPANALDDPILLNEVTDAIVSNNVIDGSGDIEIEGLGYWHLVTFAHNTFPSPTGAFIKGWYDDNRSQGFTMDRVSILSNAFKASPSCWGYSTVACGGTDAHDQAVTNALWGATNIVFDGNGVIP